MIKTGTKVYFFPSGGDIPDQLAIFYVVEEGFFSFGSVDYSIGCYSFGGEQHFSNLSIAGQGRMVHDLMLFYIAVKNFMLFSLGTTVNFIHKR